MTSIPDDEMLRRRIHPIHVKPDGGVSSAAFTNDKCSVDRSSIWGPIQSLSGYKDHGLAELMAGLARELGQEVESDPLAYNPAHALIIGRKSKATQRRLARSATWVVRIGPK